MPNCSQCDSEYQEGDKVFEVKMQDKDAPAPDFEFYTITVCSEDCVNGLSRTGRVRRVSSEQTEY